MNYTSTDIGATGASIIAAIIAGTNFIASLIIAGILIVALVFVNGYSQYYKHKYIIPRRPTNNVPDSEFLE